MINISKNFHPEEKIFLSLKAVFIFILVILVGCNYNEKDSDVLIKAIERDIATVDIESSLPKILKSEKILMSDTSLKVRSSYCFLAGVVYYQASRFEEAEQYSKKALEYYTLQGDSTGMLSSLWNIALSKGAVEDASKEFEETLKMAQLIGDSLYIGSCYEKMASISIQKKEYARALDYVDYSMKYIKRENPLYIENMLSYASLLRYQNEFFKSKSVLDSIAPESLNFYGKLSKAEILYDIYKEAGNLRLCLAFRDSIESYKDSIKSRDNREKSELLEKRYQDRMANDKKIMNFIIILSLGIIMVLSVIILLIKRNSKAMSRIFNLTQEIAELNIKLNSIRSNDVEKSYDNKKTGRDNNDNSKKQNEINVLLMRKFALSKKLLQSLPEHEKLKSFNIMPEIDSHRNKEVKLIYDVIIGRFTDCCLELRSAYSALTYEDCVYCAVVYSGCSPKMAPLALGSSVEALRQRKSRIKQKLPTELFDFLFKAE